MHPSRLVHRFVTVPLVARVTMAVVVVTALVPGFADSQEVGRSIISVGSQWPGERAWQINVSDDGRYVVYQTNHGDGWKLYLQEIGQPGSREITGLGDTPYFGMISPDGTWLLFGRKAWIWKRALVGGETTLLYTNNNYMAWETNESLLISKGAGGIWRVKADGSLKDEKIAAVDSATGATNYARPSALPGGNGVLVDVGFGTGVDLRKVGIVSLPDGKLTLLDDYGINPQYAESGHILYTQGDVLKAVPFDAEHLEVRGPSATIVEGVQAYGNGESQFDISSSGVLVWVSGPYQYGRTFPRTLVWVSRDGRETPFDTPAEKAFGVARLSPDGRYLAAEVGAGLHLFDRQSGQWSVLAETGNVGAPFWSRDSRTLYYSKAGVLGRQSVADGQEWEELWRGDTEFWGYALSGDGTQAIGTEWLPQTRMWQLMTVGLDGTHRVGRPVESGNALRRNPTLSPDGKWLAYVEKTAGLDNVYVQPFPSGGQSLLVSGDASGEAAAPTWGRTSNELFYRDGDHMVSVLLETTPELRFKRRTPLFPVRDYYNYLNTFSAVYDYDRATDRFLMIRWSIPDPGTADIQVIENAFELLNRLAPRR